MNVADFEHPTQLLDASILIQMVILECLDDASHSVESVV